MKTLSLAKMTGAGNSFLIADLVTPLKDKTTAATLRRRSRSTWAKTLCSNSWGIGADGFIVLEKDKGCDVRWDFYNADGSRAEMCGNAARCIGHYLMLASSDKQNSFSIRTRAGIVHSTVTTQDKKQFSAQVQVNMTSIKELQLDTSSTNSKCNFDFVDSGVPHAVVQYKGTRHVVKPQAAASRISSAMSALAQAIRKETRFKKTGTNVTFYETTGKNKISSLTFERGVSGYTLACGTGAVAAAVSYLQGASGCVQVSVPGGKLTVDFYAGLPRLTGASQLISIEHIIVR